MNDHFKKLVGEAEALHEHFSKIAGNLHSTTNGDKAHGLADSLDTLSGFLKRLHGNQPDAALVHLKEHFAEKGLPPVENVEHARETVAKYLQEAVATAKESPLLKKAVQAVEEFIPSEAKNGFASRMVESATSKHREWLMGKSETTRMTIANAEVFFGSVLALYGVMWAVQSLSSKRVTTREGEQGSAEFNLESVSKPRRAGGVAAGLATAAAGIGLTGLGYSSMREF